jgi:hypothetical protein
MNRLIGIAVLIGHLACEASSTARVWTRLTKPAEAQCLVNAAKDRFGAGSIVHSSASKFAVDLAQGGSEHRYANVQQTSSGTAHELAVELSWWGQKSEEKVAHVEMEELNLMRDFLVRCLRDDHDALEQVQCARSIGRHSERGCP